MIDFDSSRPSFDGDTQRGFFGGKLTYTGIAQHRPYVYVLDQQDYNDEDNALINIGGTGFPTSFEYNSTYVAVGSTGFFPCPTWSTRPRASGSPARGSVPVSRRRACRWWACRKPRRISAWAANLDLGYLLRDDNLTRLESR